MAKKILHSEDNGQPLCIFCVADVFVIVFVLLLVLLSEVQKILHPARRKERSDGPLTTIRGACSGITGRENQQSVQITHHVTRQQKKEECPLLESIGNGNKK